MLSKSDFESLGFEVTESGDNLIKVKLSGDHGYISGGHSISDRITILWVFNSKGENVGTIVGGITLNTFGELLFILERSVNLFAFLGIRLQKAMSH